MYSICGAQVFSNLHQSYQLKSRFIRTDGWGFNSQPVPRKVGASNFQPNKPSSISWDGGQVHLTYRIELDNLLNDFELFEPS